MRRYFDTLMKTMMVMAVVVTADEETAAPPAKPEEVQTGGNLAEAHSNAV